MSFPSGAKREKHILELVHTNIWGPSTISYIGGSLYYVTFIDDATRKTWICCIRNKFDVFDTFKKWKFFV